MNWGALLISLVVGATIWLSGGASSPVHIRPGRWKRLATGTADSPVQERGWIALLHRVWRSLALEDGQKVLRAGLAPSSVER